MINNNSMIGVKNQIPLMNHANTAQLPFDIANMIPRDNNRIS